MAAIQPTGTLRDGREALLRMGLALTNLSRLREGRALRGEGGSRVLVEVVLKCSESTVGGGMCITEANSNRKTHMQKRQMSDNAMMRFTTLTSLPSTLGRILIQMKMCLVQVRESH